MTVARVKGAPRKDGKKAKVDFNIDRPATVLADESDAIELPQDVEELAKCMADGFWRVCHLYKILVKGDDEDDEGTIQNFRPNRAQRRFIKRMWHRNLILKARQLGFTTLVCILWLDHALFNRDQRCGIVSYDRESAFFILRDKVKFAYDQLPASLKEAVRITSSNSTEILFSNNSSIRVAVSMRSGTIHRLHISEYGKICAKYPAKAMEVMTGSLPAVPLNGVTIIESTAEGMDGDFFKKSQKAEQLHEAGKTLSPKDFRFHFYAWWMEPKYRLPDPSTVVITAKHHNYFNEVEGIVGGGMKLDLHQRAWYVATFEGEFSSNEETMWREYPSYPGEAFKVSTEGAYYARQLSDMRRQGRITVVPFMPGYPVNTFWDLGLNDLQALWFHQHVGLQHRFIHYYENSGEGVSHYARVLMELTQQRGFTYAMHYLPHDGAHRRVAMENPETYERLLIKANVKPIRIVPKITHLSTGIDMVRDMFPQAWIDEEHCAQGIARLQNYKKHFNEQTGAYADYPKQDDNRNGADAFRQWAQGYKSTPAARSRTPKSNWRTA